ncbi:MAG: metal-sensitive transcriptional regulator [Clostridia bacterium]|jgi:DNA-binding FrmR family transcriptional regulator|nr:metal-sensitive transcriptional regulator [Clostridia bacterium]
MAETEKVDILNRLRTIRGHVGGIEKMIEEEKDCTDILIQMTAVTSSMKKVEQMINKHMAEQCVEKALNEGKDIKQEVAKLLENILKFN